MRTLLTLLFLSCALFSQAQRGGGHHHGHGHHNHYPTPMSSVEFSQAMNQMDRESFDDGKLRIAKGIINGNYLLSQQVKVLVGEFTFKDKQEELALYAYPKTYDQNKYYMVYDAFTFDSSKDKVSEWVSGQPINDYQGSNYYGPRPITDADFAQALRHVKGESFDDGKLRVAKQLVDGNYIYSDQVAVLVKEFDFKKNEEEIAKYAYEKTYDQKNYYLVYDAFTFDSSKEELERWLDGRPIRDYARPNHGNGHGHGNNNGNGYGHGNNNGNGHGHGNNNGNGHGHGNNNGNGHGHGNNNGNGHGHGNNNGNGHGHGNNNGNGYGHNNGNGNGFGNNLPPNSSNPNLGNNNTRPNSNSNTNNNSGNGDNNWNNDTPNNNVTLGQNNTNNNSQGGNIQAMSARDFDTMKARIVEFSSDDDRISKAKEYLPNNFLLAEQVKEIMGLFVFEDVRLDFAKAAYGKTYNPESYRLVKDVLVNPASQQDLQSYIDNY